MRDDERSRRCECGYRCGINNLAGHHLVGDARDRGDFRRDWLAGLTQALEAFLHAEHRAIQTVGEWRHGEFDDLVVTGVQSGSFDVDKQAGSYPVHIRLDLGRSILQLAQNTILSAFLESGHHRF